MSMSMKDLGREERGKKGAMSRQWREIGLLTKGTGPADGRAATYRCRGGGLTELYSVGKTLKRGSLNSDKREKGVRGT